MSGERSKLVFFEKVVHTHSQELGHEAYVVSMIEPMQEVYTFASG